MEKYNLIEELPGLKSVQNHFEKELRLKSGHVSQLIPWEPYGIDCLLPPALVLSTGYALGHESKRLHYLAVVVQLIAVATKIHSKVPDERGKVRLEKEQIPYMILLGDYLYSKFFDLLCEGDILYMLDPLAQSICGLHEGAMVRLEMIETGFGNETHWQDMWEGEFGSLCQASCQLAASLAGVSADKINRLGQLGKMLGMLTGFKKWRQPGQQAQKWVSAVEDILQSDFIQSKFLRSLLMTVLDTSSLQDKVKLVEAV